MCSRVLDSSAAAASALEAYPIAQYRYSSTVEPTRSAPSPSPGKGAFATSPSALAHIDSIGVGVDASSTPPSVVTATTSPHAPRTSAIGAACRHESSSSPLSFAHSGAAASPPAAVALASPTPDHTLRAAVAVSMPAMSRPAHHGLCATARAKRPRAGGAAARRSTEVPPADWPSTVTRVASAPKAAAWVFTHLSAATWSATPRLPPAPTDASPGAARKPSALSRYCTVTPTAPPAAASADRLYSGAAPVISPPPWIHTRTGAFGGKLSGTYTLSVRQLSSSPSTSPVAPGASCGHHGPCAVAFTRPESESGAGGRKRRSPTGGSAYGMPR